VTFLVNNTNPALFAVQPAVSADGTLTYTPAPDAFGSATVLVRLMDSGGTADGGQDLGPPQDFPITVTMGPRFTVINTSDSGFGSLRQAIVNANAVAGVQTIDFAIPGAGPFTIAPTSALPPLTEAVILDGYTQPGARPNTLPGGDDAVLLVELSGVNLPRASAGW
jgi:hypothetical protein